MKKRIAVFISGRGSNMTVVAESVQNGILKDLCEIVLVFSNKDGVGGLKNAADMGLETACMESRFKKREEFESQLLQLLGPFNIDYVVLAGFMRILSPLFIRAYKNRIINIHPANTEEFQGVGAYEWAFKNKKPFTEITVHFVDEGVDTGPVVGRRKVELNGVYTLKEVETLGLKVEHEFYSEALRQIFSGEFKL